MGRKLEEQGFKVWAIVNRLTVDGFPFVIPTYYHAVDFYIDEKIKVKDPEEYIDGESKPDKIYEKLGRIFPNDRYSFTPPKCSSWLIKGIETGTLGLHIIDKHKLFDEYCRLIFAPEVKKTSQRELIHLIK